MIWRHKETAPLRGSLIGESGAPLGGRLGGRKAWRTKSGEVHVDQFCSALARCSDGDDVLHRFGGILINVVRVYPLQRSQDDVEQFDLHL